MLGHKLWQVCNQDFDTFVTFRKSARCCDALAIFDPARSIEGVHAEDFSTVERAIAETAPEFVINCIGVVKQTGAGKDPVNAISINALFPHKLAGCCSKNGVRVIHISTDCVFSGRSGQYCEDDNADAEDLYGRTKYLGELREHESALTIRTSIVGRELSGRHGLLEWFLSQGDGPVPGYARARFSGLTTFELANTIYGIIRSFPTLSGVWHIAGEPITKLDLLRLVNEVYHRNTSIVPDSAFACDRTLDDSRFRKVTGLPRPGWNYMVRRMYEDQTPYEALRGRNA
jgi:dTDP-4-dehydrorhamnose reductase